MRGLLGITACMLLVALSAGCGGFDGTGGGSPTAEEPIAEAIHSDTSGPFGLCDSWEDCMPIRLCEGPACRGGECYYETVFDGNSCELPGKDGMCIDGECVSTQ